MTPNDPSDLETALIAGLAITADKLTTAALDLRDATRVTRTMRVVVGVGMVLLVGLTAVALQNWANGTRARQSVAAIKDCTEVTGRCYQKQQQQGALFMAQLISRNIEGFLVVSECSRTTKTNAALEACVRHRLPR